MIPGTVEKGQGQRPSIDIRRRFLKKKLHEMANFYLIPSRQITSDFRVGEVKNNPVFLKALHVVVLEKSNDYQ